MEITEQSNIKEVAYLREFEQSKQCELFFVIQTSIPQIGLINEEIKALRQLTHDVSSLLQHIKNKVEKLLHDKFENCNHQDQLQKSDFKMPDIHVHLRHNKESFPDDMILKDLCQLLLTKKMHTTFEIFDKIYVVTINSPMIKHLKLPSIIYATFTIQPIKFYTIFTNNKNSQFSWYKSSDKMHWSKVGDEFLYVVKIEDVGFYLKLICIPCTDQGDQGPPAEAICERKVKLIGDIPYCPFQKRHALTRTKLKLPEFRVVSYNLLAERYTAIDDNYSYCDPKFLAVDYRKRLIVKELTGYNADIICLQEVDNRHYTNYYKDILKDYGYHSLYNRKGNCIPEGLACFFNKSNFTKVEAKHIVFSRELQSNKLFAHLWKSTRNDANLKNYFLKQSTSLQVTVFKCNHKNKHLIVANTHLFYHPDANHIRLMQINMATTYLNMIRKKYQRDNKDISLIFCGDFNSSFTKSLYTYMIQGRINPSHEDCLKIDENGRTHLYHEFIFKSACGTPKYTNYTPDYKGCLDYIFIESNKFDVIQVVPLTDEEELALHEGLPNKYFPSDHMALVADINFL